MSRSGLQQLRRTFWRGLEPQALLSVSEWADANRVLDSRSSAEPGEYRTSRAPFLREVMDSLGPGGPVEVVVKKGAQLGFTEAGNNWIGYCIEHQPGPMLYVQPTEGQAKKYSKQRLAPMFAASPVLSKLVSAAKTRDSKNTILEKVFAGGTLSMIGSNSASALASTPIRFAFGDEMDRYPGDVDREGDPVELLRARTFNFKVNRKLFFPCTPTEMGFSRIDRRYRESDQRLYFITCPECGHAAPLFFRGYMEIIPEQHLALEPHLLLEDSPEMLCQSCGGLTPESAKTKLIADKPMGGTAEWRPTAVAVEPGLRGYAISALYSPAGWISWGDVLAGWRRAKAAGVSKMKPFVNTVLGEAYQAPGESVPASALQARLEDYDAQVPAGVLWLTIGIDVQADRVEGEVVGHGHGDETWSIEYFIIHGNTNHGAVWERVAEYLDREWEHELGVKMKARPVLIDSGYRPKRVYDFARPREHREVFACKGRKGVQDLPIVTPSSRSVGKKNRKKPLRAALWIVGTDEAKSVLMDQLNVDEPGPGYCHFPTNRENYDEEHFKQLTAERRVIDENGKAMWKKTRDRNEALDCRVYAMAAKEIRRPDYVRLERQMKRAVARAERAAKGEKEPEKKKPRRVSARGGRSRSGGAWMDGGSRRS